MYKTAKASVYARQLGTSVLLIAIGLLILMMFN